MKHEIIVNNNKIIARSNKMPFPIRFVLDYVDLSNVNVVLDVGAMDCKEAREFNQMWPNAKIYSFEPNPESIPICKNRIIGVKNIELIEKAVSNCSGRVKFYPTDMTRSSDKNIGISSLLKLKTNIPHLPFKMPTNAWIQKEVEVDCITLDEFCNERNLSPDILWMDVQGAELLALQGFKENIRSVRLIMTEAGVNPYYEGHTLLPDINEFLVNSGFEIICNDISGGKALKKHGFELNIIYVNKEFRI